MFHILLSRCQIFSHANNRVLTDTLPESHHYMLNHQNLIYTSGEKGVEDILNYIKDQNFA